MIESVPSHALAYEFSGAPGESIVIRFSGRMDAQTAETAFSNLLPDLLDKKPAGIVADLEAVEYFDDYGALVLAELQALAEQRHLAYDIAQASPRALEILSRFPKKTPADGFRLRGRREDRFLEKLGEATLGQAFNLRYLLSFLGSALIAFFKVLANPRLLRVSDTLTCMEKTGFNALPIVGMISFLLGLVMAFMSSLQLQQFGANIFVASLVAIAMVSELGPIMTAIVVAGRSGSAFAAEIGTMKISEEVDALFSMGFDPTIFLAMPRIVASVIVVPLLTLFADICGIAGGLVIGVFVLDLTASVYITQTLKVLSLFEVVWGLSKSIVFAMLISWIGCLRGFQTRGGADAVGNAATSAVVSSIFLIILFDSAFAVARSYW